jgi:hypothetical protein
MPLSANFIIADITNPEVRKLHNNLSTALNNNIVFGFKPGGTFTSDLVSGVNEQQFVVFSQLAAAVEPLIVAAVAASLIPGNTPITAWDSVKLTIDSFKFPPPAVLTQGPLGPIFWDALLNTVKLSKVGVPELLV